MRIPSNLEIRNSPVHGKGIFCLEQIQSGDILGEFTGTKMLKTEFTKLYGKDIQHTYWTSQNFSKTFVIVAKDPRNFITYINESFNPNVKLIKTQLVAINNIEIGDELFLRYNKLYKRDYKL